MSEITGARVIDIVRGKNSVFADGSKLKFQSGDKIILSCKPEGFVEANDVEGLDLFGALGLGIEHISSNEGFMVEAMVRPSSSIIHKTLAEVNFRSKFNLTILAIHRKEKHKS